MTNHVSFPIAKLLKEKDFHEETWQSYRTVEHTEERLKWWKVGELNKPMYCRLRDNNDAYFEVCSAPTITEVVMWIYKKHGIWIMAKIYGDYFKPDITNKKAPIGDGYLSDCEGKLFNSPTEAYEAAIEYCLTKLIK